MSKRGTNQQSTTSGGSGDGSASVRGLDELLAGSGGAKQPRRPRRGDQMTGVTLDGTRSVEMAARNAEAVEAQRLVNSGAANSDGAGPVKDPANLLGGGGSKPVSTCADPSSLSSHSG
jgi:hypothetical protein